MLLRFFIAIAVSIAIFKDLAAQNSYKVIFDGVENTFIGGIDLSVANEFVTIKMVYPLNTNNILSSEVYTFNNNNPLDTTRWNLDLIRQDSVFQVVHIREGVNGGIIIVGRGTTYCDTAGINILERFNWLMCLDGEKNLVWEKCYSLPEEIPRMCSISYCELLLPPSGNIIIAETIHSDSIPGLMLNMLILEISPEGSLTKTKVFDQSHSGNVRSILYSADSSTILLLTARSWINYCQNGSTEEVIVLDPVNYNVISGFCLHGNGFGFMEPFYGMLDDEGNLIVAGTYTNSVGNATEHYLGIEKYDTDYQFMDKILLTNPDTMTYAAWGKSLDINEQGEICVAGSFDNALGIFTGYNDLVYIAKLDPFLNLISERYIGRDAEYSVYCMSATTDGGIVVGGYQYDYLVNQDYEGDAFVLKTDAGLWVDTPELLEEDIHRALVYPNPGKSELSIRTTVKQTVFRLYDISGHVILECPINQLTTTLPVGYLSNGVYWWTITQHENISDRGKWIKL